MPNSAPIESSLLHPEARTSSDAAPPPSVPGPGAPGSVEPDPTLNERVERTDGPPIETYRDSPPQGATAKLDLSPGPVRAGVCHQCGRVPLAGRNFCDCGTELASNAPVESHPVEAEPPPSSWWRRITGTGFRDGKDERTWSQRARDSGAIDRLQYESGISSRTRFLRVGSAVGALMLLITLVGPLRDRVSEIPGLFFPPEEQNATVQGLPGQLDSGAEPHSITWPFAPWTGLPVPEKAEDCGDDRVRDRLAARVPTDQPNTEVVDQLAMAGSFSDGPIDPKSLLIQFGPTRGEDANGIREPTQRVSLVEIVVFQDAGGEETCILQPVADAGFDGEAGIEQEFRVDADGAIRFQITVAAVHAVPPPLVVSDTIWIEGVRWIEE